jgi:hypothetical protein
MHILYLSPLYQVSLLPSEHTVLRPSTICRGVSSLFPTSYHPILSTSSLLAATHTTPILLSAGSGSRLLPTLRHRGSKVPGTLTSSLDEERAVNEEIQWPRKLRDDREKGRRNSRLARKEIERDETKGDEGRRKERMEGNGMNRKNGIRRMKNKEWKEQTKYDK